jgi:hypothetical protein
MNPLIQDLRQLSDADLDAKTRELTKKYYTVAKMGNRDMAQQIFMLMDEHMAEKKRREDEAFKRARLDSPDDLNGLINIG